MTSRGLRVWRVPLLGTGLAAPGGGTGGRAPRRRGGRSPFARAIALLLIGVAVATRRPDAGVRVLGAGLFALAWWLARHDLGRRTAHRRGRTPFMASGAL